MSRKNTNINLISTSIILLLQLAFLYYLKYSNQSLPLSNFSILKTGNLLNFLLYAGILAGIFIAIRKNKTLVIIKTITSLIIISWLLLIISFLSTRFEVVSDGSYLLSQPTGKVITGILFLSYLMSLFYFLLYLWLTIFKIDSVKFIKLVSFTFILLVTFWVVILLYIDNAGYTSEHWSISKNEKNVAVVLGAAVWSGNKPSPTLSARVDKAIELLNNEFIGEIVLTGGKAPGELPESEVAYEYSRAKGVDTSLFKIESSTSSTSDQIRWIKQNLGVENQTASVILVSDAYHLPRAIEISKFFNLDVKVAESVHKLTFKDMIYNKIRESIALFNFWNFAL